MWVFLDLARMGKTNLALALFAGSIAYAQACKQNFSPPASKLKEETEVTEGGTDGQTDRRSLPNLNLNILRTLA